MVETRDGISDPWGMRTPFRGEGAWPARADVRTTATPDRWVQSACVLCSNGCALDVGVAAGRIVGVRGRPLDRSNRGRLGPKGLYGWAANNSAERLTHPLIRDGGLFREASWDEAMSLIVRRSRETIDRYTPGAIGIYSSGQLMLEEYYTLAVIAKAGLGTPHVDGNIRLCTATASAALKESFGADGQPGSVEDLDTAACILLAGHNPALTTTVMWMRILDRRRGPAPPRLIVIDPRRTPTAAEADIWLAPRAGTNLALLNGLLHLLIEGGHVDTDFVASRTTGMDALRTVVAAYPPGRVQGITGVPEALLRQAAATIGQAPSLVSSCLQGIYQSHQATASACQVNNIHLLRGMIGRPGCGVLQMNGQPTAQNTRECGVFEDLSGCRNWQNPEHVAELARLWNVPPAKLPHWAPGTTALDIFRYAEAGTIRMLWIQGTNPAVSMPDLPRIRALLGRPGLFTVVQDVFMTETAQLADVVLPAAIWAERTGTFTNFDRTVHISRKAVEPPGQARSDLDIFLDYARRMDFRDQDGAPLIKWSTPEAAFDAWKACSRGRPCDYTGLTYDKLSGGSGVPWPCNAAHPQGTVRLYQDHVFSTDPDTCQTFGHDLQTGAAVTPEDYRAADPRGRAFLKAVHYQSPSEVPDDEYPFILTSGRVLTQFHTRTKTGRVAELNDAAPAPLVEITRADAARLGVEGGTMLRLRSRRGAMRARARIGDGLNGHVFVPFHYGNAGSQDGLRAANELTRFAYDPVSKQPQLKYAAISIALAETDLDAEDVRARIAFAPVPTAATPPAGIRPQARGHVSDFLRDLDANLVRLARGFAQLGAARPDVPDLVATPQSFADALLRQRAALRPFLVRYPGPAVSRATSDGGPGTGYAAGTALGLLRDLQRLHALAAGCGTTIEIMSAAAAALRDQQLASVISDLHATVADQLSWLDTELRRISAQALTVPQ